jgi:elongator complex protein 3
VQARIRAITDIVSALVQGVKAGTDVDLNDLKRKAGAKYGLGRCPKLVEIIAALPEEHRAALLPQ